MKEEKRISIVNFISSVQKRQEEYEIIQQKIDELSKHPEVLEYIHLKNRISALGHDKSIVNNNYVSYFRAAVFGESCDHPLYMYIGPYRERKSFWESDQPLLDENDPEHSHNLYYCLECGQKIKILKEQCQEFETNNFVIVISRNDHNTNTSKFREYNDYYYYYQLLLEGSTDQAITKMRKLVKEK